VQHESTNFSEPAPKVRRVPLLGLNMKYNESQLMFRDNISPVVGKRLLGRKFGGKFRVFAFRSAER
jgi:hypothetical protein